MTISTAPWAAIYSDIWTSRKLHLLRRSLGISAETAVGHLLRLWHTCLTSAPLTGELEDWTALDVADASGWPEADAERWTNALLDAGWLEHNDVCDFVLHEWQGYGGQFLVSKEAGRLRKAKWRNEVSRGRPGDITGTEQGRPGEVSVTSQTTSPNLTSPDLTQPHPTPPERESTPPVQEPQLPSKALEDARAAVIRDNRNARNDKKAKAEEIYGRPQSPDALMVFVGIEDVTVESYLAGRFPLFDGKDGRPYLIEVVTTLWPAMQGQPWGISGRDAIRWLVKRMADDHQKLRQSEHIIGEKKAKGITLPAENEARAEQAPDRAADKAAYDAAYARSTCDSFPTFSAWKAMGRPQVVSDERSPPEAAPPTIDMLPEPTEAEAKQKTEALAALARLADGFTAKPVNPRRLRLAGGGEQ